jgi:sarcosine oxidase subunit gamma
MAELGAAVRRPKLAGRMSSSERARIVVLPPATRLALRAPEASRAALGQALALDLPATPKRSATAEGRAALWLGPDEWLVIDHLGRDIARELSGVDALHSAVDVSHRNVAIEVEGAAAEAILAAGCPQDLSSAAFPAGACSRTVLGKVEIVLLRTGHETFRIECWRSFSDYVLTFLAQAAAHQS